MMWRNMSDKPRQPVVGPLPDFLSACVQKGIVDLRTAQRVELHRRSRGLGKYESRSSFMNDPPDPTLTFDNYAVCKGNSFAVELAKTVAYRSPSQLPYNPLYIYGEIGLGKTHLLSAIANAAQDKEVLLVNAADLETELERAERLKSRAELREWLASAEILLVDDIQLCEGRENVQRDLFSVLNHMTKTHRWVVISSDVPPTRLAGMESRLLSRLRGGVIVSLQMGNRNERRDLIRRLLYEHPMPEDVVDYLAENITDNVRRLKGAIAQLLTLSEGKRTPLTVAFAQAIVPSPEIVPQPVNERKDVSVSGSAAESQPTKTTDSKGRRFKEMLAGAESEEEQALALQIALGERIRQLRNEQKDVEDIPKLEQALELLRERKIEEAIRCVSS